MHPSNSLPEILTIHKGEGDPSSSGISPVRSLFVRPRVSSSVRFPSSGGMVPVRRLVPSPKDVRAVSCPISGIKVPLRLLSRSVSSVTFPWSLTRTPCHVWSGMSESQFSLLCHWSPLVALYSLTSTSLSSASDGLDPQKGMFSRSKSWSVMCRKESGMHPSNWLPPEDVKYNQMR